MKKHIRAFVSLLCAAALALGCASCGGAAHSTGKSGGTAGVTHITVWTYYNGDQLESFNKLVDQFNETTGREKGIRVESASQGSVSDLETNVMDAAQGKVGAAAMPNIFSAYADTAYALDQMGMLVDLSQYLTEDERARYVQDYLDEGDFDGDGNVPLVTGIKVDQKANTITVATDPTRDCRVIEWIADGKVIATGNTIDLNDYEKDLGCYIRFQMKGSGGVTYSQPFELQYKGRIDKPVPSWALWVFKTEAGQKFMKFYHSHSFALGALIAEKIRILIEDNIKK